MRGTWPRQHVLQKIRCRLQHNDASILHRVGQHPGGARCGHRRQRGRDTPVAQWATWHEAPHVLGREKETLVDAANPVVKLCAEGMMAEGRGRPDEARDLFAQAWAASGDDFEACIAAHYLARHQQSPQETLRWNRESLARADAVGDERVRGFSPSLYLNVGHSCEALGDLAAASAADLPADGYSAMVRRGIAAGQRRSEASGE